MSSATEHLATLDAKATEANERYRRALDAVQRRNHYQAGVDVLTPLHDYFHGVQTKQREADLDELHQLTADACERIVDEGLVLEVPAPGQVRIADLSFDQEKADALKAWNAARAERDEYEAATRDERAAERKKAEANKIKNALSGDDPDAIREALNGPQGDGPLTSTDLQREKTGTIFHV